MHTINLDNIIRGDYPKVITDSARAIQKVGYITVGDFLQSLDDEQLLELNDLSILISLGRASERVLSSMVVMAEMLAQAEGAVLEYDGAAGRAGNLMILLSMEGLHRQGFAKFNRSVATLDGDLPGEIIDLS